MSTTEGRSKTKKRYLVDKACPVYPLGARILWVYPMGACMHVHVRIHFFAVGRNECSEYSSGGVGPSFPHSLYITHSLTHYIYITHSGTHPLFVASIAYTVLYNTYKRVRVDRSPMTTNCNEYPPALRIS